MRSQGKRFFVVAAFISIGLLAGCRGVGLLGTLPPAAPTASISASPGTLDSGSSATLTWTTANATSVSINQGVGTVAASGSMKVSPSATTQYTLTAIGTGGTTTATATVTIHDLPPKATLTANPTTITAGNHSTLTWTTTDATTVTIEPGIGTVSASGSTTVSPAVTTKYTLTATGQGGTTTVAATVTVPIPPPTATISADPATITAGNKSTLTWATTNATTVSISPGIGIVSASGSTTVSPTITTAYTLTATGASGTATASTTVTVNGIGVNSPIQHLIILMMQNHSFDNLFGNYPGANGLDASLPSYHQVDAQGNTISPTPITSLTTADLTHDEPHYSKSWDNGKMDKFAYTEGDLSMQYYDYNNPLSGLTTDKQQYSMSTFWNYAKQYALADNFYMPAMNSEPADELLMVSATVHSNHDAAALPILDACTAQEQQTDGGTTAEPLTETNVGDQLSAANIPWTAYQQSFTNEQNGTCKDYVPQENMFQYFQSTANSSHIQDVSVASFKAVLTSDSLPSVAWVTPDGALDMHPGGGNILDGVQWLDEIVQAVKASSYWPNTAIIVLFDEGGGWYDHVPPPQLSNVPAGWLPGGQGLGFRVPVILISPYAKTNYISSQEMDFVSILRFIQWNWNLGEIPATDQQNREQQSGDICDLLTASTPCGAPTP